MTFQPPSQTHDNDDNADEASSLLRTVAEGDVPTTKKKNGGVPMRAMIATCVLLGTLAVIYVGRGSSNISAGVISAALVLGQNSVASVYDPSQDYCFTDTDNADKYCWFPIDRYPCGNWQGVTCAGGHGCDQCGDRCTTVYCNRPDGGGECVNPGPHPDPLNCLPGL